MQINREKNDSELNLQAWSQIYFVVEHMIC